MARRRPRPLAGGAGFDFASRFFPRVPHPCGLCKGGVVDASFCCSSSFDSSEPLPLIEHFSSSLLLHCNLLHGTQYALPLCFLLFAKSFEQKMSTREILVLY